MADDRQLLALELKQIIQADRMAADILADANATRKTLEQKTAKEAAGILAEAERQKAEQLQKEKAEQEQKLQAHTQKLQARFAAQQKQLEETVAAKREGWIDEMVKRICSLD